MMPVPAHVPTRFPSFLTWVERPLFVTVLLLGIVCLAWSNSLSAPFVFDDYPSIVENTSIRSLRPSSCLWPPATAGETVSGRPILNLSFALNYAVGELDVRGYHVVNILIHVACALLLWGLLRRHSGRLSGAVALSAALLWSLHPLHTSAITYVVQRAESLAAFFILLACYCFVRGAERVSHQRANGSYLKPWYWFLASVLGCLLGVGTKETAAVIPLIVLLYDRAFLAGSFAQALRLRGRVHFMLFLTWIPLTVLIVTNQSRGGSAGMGAGDHWTYLATQAGAILHYLRLVVWPTGQIFDYGMQTTGGGHVAVLAQGLVVVGLVGASVWALIRNHALGFAGAAFFLMLAPSSSFIPVATQVIAEHRMYLPAAVPLVLISVLLSRAVTHHVFFCGLVGVVTVALGVATRTRNELYRSPLALWEDTASKRPVNARAHYNFGLALGAAGQSKQAAKAFLRTLEVQPHHAFAHFELGKQALLGARWQDAINSFGAAVDADPHWTSARVNKARALAATGRIEEAVTEYRVCLLAEPDASDVRASLAGLLVEQGNFTEAVAMLRHVQSADSWHSLGNALARRERLPEAIDAFNAALAIDPSYVQARNNLANCQLMLGWLPDAIRNYEEVLRIKPNDASVRENLQLAREMQGQAHALPQI